MTKIMVSGQQIIKMDNEIRYCISHTKQGVYAALYSKLEYA
jgi:hypothetical protein